MSADAFHVFYGIRRQFDASDEEQVALLELRKHPSQVSAKKQKLDLWWGAADEGTCFVLVGTRVGRLGSESDALVQISDGDMRRIADDTRERLHAAGFDSDPAWFFQFEPG